MASLRYFIYVLFHVVNRLLDSQEYLCCTLAVWVAGVLLFFWFCIERVHLLTIYRQDQLFPILGFALLEGELRAVRAPIAVC